ncbi:prepilin-type N-terminal cleavage/methylation domain-containing protein [Candidatus Competibacter phosphatis]|uniref:Prepilin-type N-terminal cleavage/methylation domain-containing protein n=1 Tax=Candidatus Competibacter phosphatis TaxID=221280 RepID=A0ABX1TLG6_9GAMM|nr:type IV pilin protein [Candidatus Competibacter phosphatis]NMQ20262.1 prepilin-type N-terminal cleavage/methylation domain-containing protein [Candidatus Competibacter phosphatis]
MSKYHGKGFTLIELMIVVAVIAILAAIAYPSYQDSVRKSRRADAKGVLQEASQWMERFYTENNRYDQNRAGTVVTDATQFLGSGLVESPKEGGAKYYDITLSAVAQNSYTLQAAPKGAQSGDPCGTLTLTDTGVKNVTGGSYTKDRCW